jgi:hypothetical protein
LGFSKASEKLQKAPERRGASETQKTIEILNRIDYYYSSFIGFCASASAGPAAAECVRFGNGAKLELSYFLLGNCL